MVITATLSRVVDGDSINIDPPYEEEDSIRLLGIDTPEIMYYGRSQGEHAENASEFLKDLIRPGDEVRIETDTEERDKYGRILGYVFKDDVNLNLRLLEEGLAVSYQIYPNFKCLDEFRAAVISSISRDKGIYNPDNPLKELPFEFRMRVSNRQPRKYVGDCTTKVYYDPHEYKSVEIANRVFFFKEQNAVDAGYTYKTEPVTKPTDISQFVVRAYERLSFTELLDSPVEALRGVSKADAQSLRKSFDIQTIGELADCKYFKWARAIKNFKR